MVRHRLAFAARLTITLTVAIPLTIVATTTEVVRRIRDVDRARQVRAQALMTKRIEDTYFEEAPMYVPEEWIS